MKRTILILLVHLAITASLSAQNDTQKPVREGTPGVPGRLEISGEAAEADGGIIISPLSDGIPEEQMVETILGTGVDISNVSYTGAFAASGVFTNGTSTGIDFESGIILSSGLAESILGPNNVSNASNSNGLPGDADLTSIIGNNTYDASVLEFDFIPTNSVLTFNYVLFSEEYPEFLNYSDVFAFILDGVNIALIPGTTEPVAIGTVNHLSNEDYYVSNQSAIYNVQADGFTTVFTASAQVAMNQPHHIKLAIADMGDYAFDSWVLIEGNSFSSLGSIIGTVYDMASGTPLPDATLTAYGKSTFETESNMNGDYLLVNLPFGYDYSLEVVAPGYQAVTINGINLMPRDPIHEVDVYLDPIQGNYELSSMVPDLNPAVSTAMPNAKMVHRYYFIRNTDDDSPGVSIPVEVMLGSIQKTYKSDERGIIDIAIPEVLLPDVVGSILNCQITDVFYESLDSPIDFQVQIVDENYEKYWGESHSADLKILNWGGGIASDAVTRVIETNSSNNDPEDMKMTLGGEAHLELISAGVGVDAVVKVNDFTAGVQAKADAGVNVGIDGERGLKFDYISQSNKEALAKYYYYSKGHLDLFDISLIRLSTLVEEYLFENFVVDGFNDYAKGGIWVEGTGDAKAKLGLPLALSPFWFSAGADVSANARASAGFIANADMTSSLYNGLSFGADAGATTDLMINLPDGEFTQNLEEKLSFFDNDVSGEWQRGISFVLDEDCLEISLIKRNVHNDAGWQTDARYRIMGEDVLYYFSSIDLVSAMVEYYEGQGTLDVINLASGPIGFIGETFEILGNLGSEMLNGKLMVEYETNRSDFTEEQIFDLYIGIGAELGLKVSGSLGAGKSVEEGRSRLIEDGEWLNFAHYPQVEYNTNIPDIAIEYQELIQGIVDDIPAYIKILYGAYKVFKITNPLKSAEEMMVLDLGNDSYLEIDTDIVPAGTDSIYCYSWGWYGETGATKSAAKKSTHYDVYESYRKAAQEIYQMEYGIGGFYQFEPGSLVLNGTADLTLSYQDEEVDGLNEAELGIYLENKSLQRWEYIGGVVDIQNNHITAPVSELGVYTIAPAIPDGEIVLTVEHDSIPADGVSTSLITSNPVYYNNTTLVKDGELFTVVASFGTILNDDLDDAAAGVQLAAHGGIVQVELRSTTSGALSEVSISSFTGYAEGSAEVTFVDEDAPEVPVLISAEGVNSDILVDWTAVGDEDLAGYKVYFDSDSDIPPFSGIAKIQGSPSPITVGIGETAIISYLFEDSTYHVAVTAFDHSGNESDYSNVLTTGLSPNQHPVILPQDLFFQDICNNASQVGAILASDPDGDDLSFSILGGKNANFFEIDEATGIISLKTGIVNYDAQQNLLVEVTDNGPGSLSSTAIVTVTTDCEDNHAPVCNDFSVVLREDELASEFVLATVEASDQDAGQMISFRMASGDELNGFGVDENSGELFIASPDDISFDDNWSRVLHVVASDNGEGWLTDTAMVTIQFTPTSNRSISADESLVLYPNPTTGKVYVHSEKWYGEEVSMEIFSIIGEQMLISRTEKMFEDRIELDLSNFESGVYILRVKKGQSTSASYIIRQ